MTGKRILWTKKAYFKNSRVTLNNMFYNRNVAVGDVDPQVNYWFWQWTDRVACRAIATRHATKAALHTGFT